MRCNQLQQILECTSISEGIATGKAFIYRDILTRDISSYSISEKNISHELSRITSALLSVKKDLHKLSHTVSDTISSKEGSIFDAQRMMLEDEAFIDSFETEMKNELINAEQVLKNVFRKQINRFECSENEVFRAKADDLKDILRKLLRNLLGIDMSVLAKLPENSIIISRRLLPSDTIMLDIKNARGIIVEEGSIYSHSAIMARSLGIPALLTNGTSLRGIGDGTPIIVDGNAEKAIIHPHHSTISLYRHRQVTLADEFANKLRAIKGVSRTRSGRMIHLMANASTLQEVQCALESGCDGIGLFRTETIYLQNRTLPGEDELYAQLYTALEPARNVPITVRVLDIGGDKRLPYLQNTTDEISPFLGLRGIRFLLRNPVLLKTQLKVFLKLHQEFNIKVLLPMVTLPEEIRTVLDMVAECREELKLNSKRKKIKIGCMIETPASALGIEKILEVSDFISVGTNDLIQYVMAASRENPDVANYYKKGIDYILPVVKNIEDACRQADRECCICGEIVNDEHCLEKFMACGVSQFSISAYRIPHLKAHVRGLS